MSSYLLDTNVISESFLALPDRRVEAFLASSEPCWISSIVLHELYYGINLLQRGTKRNRLENLLDHYQSSYADFILPLTLGECRIAARFRVSARKQGRVMELADALIAATAATNHLILATRNTKDFDGLDIALYNPWEENI